jgi:hypothetical protein
MGIHIDVVHRAQTGSNSVGVLSQMVLSALYFNIKSCNPALIQVTCRVGAGAAGAPDPGHHSFK